MGLASVASSCSSSVHLLLKNSLMTRPFLSSGWDLHDAVYSRELLISNRANGYRDILASIDLSTFRRIPWENNVPFFLISFLDPDSREPLSVCPRSVLKRTAEKAEQSGWSCYAGVEYEVCHFNFRN